MHAAGKDHKPNKEKEKHRNNKRMAHSLKRKDAHLDPLNALSWLVTHRICHENDTLMI